MPVNIMGWPTAADNPYGVTHGAFTPVAANGSVNYIDPQLFIDANAAGMSRVRLQLSAILIETANGVFDWRYLDDAVQKANAAGLRVTFPIREFGPKGLPNQSWATMSSPCGPGESYYYGTVTNWVNFAVALAQRYSGDGNPNNKLATDGSGRPLIIDSIEIGNEDFDVHGSTSDD